MRSRLYDEEKRKPVGSRLYADAKRRQEVEKHRTEEIEYIKERKRKRKAKAAVATPSETHTKLFDDSRRRDREKKRKKRMVLQKREEGKRVCGKRSTWCSNAKRETFFHIPQIQRILRNTNSHFALEHRYHIRLK